MKYSICKEVRSPTSSSLKLIDDATELIKFHLSEQTKWFHIYAKEQRGRIALDLDLLREYVGKNDRVLELGSVPLLLTVACQYSGYDIQGVDIAPERYEAAINHIGLLVRKCNIELDRLPFADSSFNTILFFEIFEHLRINLIFTMKEVFRVMRPGGILLLSTPNLKSFHGTINFLFRTENFSGAQDIYTQYEKLEIKGHMGHVREYSAYELSAFLTKIGFRVNEVMYRGSYGSRRIDLPLKLFHKLRPNMVIIATK